MSTKIHSKYLKSLHDLGIEVLWSGLNITHIKKELNQKLMITLHPDKTCPGGKAEDICSDGRTWEQHQQNFINTNDQNLSPTKTCPSGSGAINCPDGKTFKEANDIFIAAQAKEKELIAALPAAKEELKNHIHKIVEKCLPGSHFTGTNSEEQNLLGDLALSLEEEGYCS